MQKLLWAGLLLFVAVFGWMLWSLTRTSPQTVREYQAIIAQTKEEVQSPLYVSNQQREQVVKDIFLMQESGRLQMHIVCKDSRIVFETNGREAQLVEHLKDIHALFQEELGNTNHRPTQIVQAVRANEGTYNYQLNRFVTEDVEIARYLVDGHRLPDQVSGKPLMSGRAKSAVFTFDDTFQFTAQKMRATLHTLEK